MYFYLFFSLWLIRRRKRFPALCNKHSCRPAGRDDLGSSALRHSYNITDTSSRHFRFALRAGPTYISFFLSVSLLEKKEKKRDADYYYLSYKAELGRRPRELSWVDSTRLCVCRWRRCGSFILILCHLRPQKKKYTNLSHRAVCFAFIFASKARDYSLWYGLLTLSMWCESGNKSVSPTPTYIIMMP